MSYVIYGSPATPPVPAPDPWSHLDMTWTGWDGVVWSLSGPRTAGVRMQAGMTGLTMPTAIRHTTATPGRGGTRYRGTDVLERDVFWPLWVWQQSGSQAWLEHDAAFRRSFRFDRLGTWAVRQPETGAERRLDLRFVGDNGKAWEKTPGSRAWAPYDLSLVAEDPYWRGQAVRSPVWSAATGVNFTGPEDAAPSYHVSGATTTGAASLHNPGDVPAWPVWTIRGPVETAVLSVDGFAIGVPFAVPDGQVLTIDTETGGARLDGERVGHLLDPREFEPIRDGGAVPIEITIVGTGAAQARLVPRYMAAW